MTAPLTAPANQTAPGRHTDPTPDGSATTQPAPAPGAALPRRTRRVPGQPARRNDTPRLDRSEVAHRAGVVVVALFAVSLLVLVALHIGAARPVDLAALPATWGQDALGSGDTLAVVRLRTSVGDRDGTRVAARTTWTSATAGMRTDTSPAASGDARSATLDAARRTAPVTAPHITGTVPTSPWQLPTDTVLALASDTDDVLAAADRLIAQRVGEAEPAPALRDAYRATVLTHLLADPHSLPDQRRAAAQVLMLLTSAFVQGPTISAPGPYVDVLGRHGLAYTIPHLPAGDDLVPGTSAVVFVNLDTGLLLRVIGRANDLTTVIDTYAYAQLPAGTATGQAARAHR